MPDVLSIRDLHQFASSAIRLTNIAPALFSAVVPREGLQVEADTTTGRHGERRFAARVTGMAPGVPPIFLRPPRPWRNAEEKKPHDYLVVTFVAVPTKVGGDAGGHAVKVIPRWGWATGEMPQRSGLLPSRDAWARVLFTTDESVARALTQYQDHVLVYLARYRYLAGGGDMVYGLRLTPEVTPGGLALWFDHEPRLWVVFEPWRKKKEVSHD